MQEQGNAPPATYGQIGLTPWDYLYIVWRRKRWVILTFLVGTVITVVYSFSLPLHVPLLDADFGRTPDGAAKLCGLDRGLGHRRTPQYAQSADL